MEQSGKSLKSFWVRAKGNIGNHWSSIWLEWMDQHFWPFRASGVSYPTPEQDCCLRLNCEMAFYRPARQRGFDKLAQHWLVAKALTTNYQRQYKEQCCTRWPIWGHGSNGGPRMTWHRQSSVRTREAMGLPSTTMDSSANVKLQRELP